MAKRGSGALIWVGAAAIGVAVLVVGRSRPKAQPPAPTPPPVPPPVPVPPEPAPTGVSLSAEFVVWADSGTVWFGEPGAVRPRALFQGGWAMDEAEVHVVARASAQTPQEADYSVSITGANGLIRSSSPVHVVLTEATAALPEARVAVSRDDPVGPLVFTAVLRSGAQVLAESKATGDLLQVA